MAQLIDDTLGPILRQVETNPRPNESTLACMGHEACQLQHCSNVTTYLQFFNHSPALAKLREVTT